MPSKSKEPIAAAIPADLHEKIVEHCKQNNISKNAFIGQCLEEYFYPVATVKIEDNGAVDRLINYVANNTLLSRKDLKKIANA